jgi:hypothetical protein
MSVMLPGDLVFVLNLIGFNWPTADEDKLRQSAQHWREYASELEHVTADTSRILDQVVADNSGESIDALEQHWRDFAEHLRRGHDAAETVAEVLDDFALVVEGLKVAVLVQLGILAGELAATTGAAFLTFGVAEAAAPEEIGITQLIMRGLSREAIQKAERMVAEKVAKTVTEHFLSIKNGLKALKAAPTALRDFGKALVKDGRKAMPDLRIYASEGRRAVAEDVGVLLPGKSGKLFATDARYEYGNIAQSNLAIMARGEDIVGYWKVPAKFSSKFTYVGRVGPSDDLLWEGGGREFTRPGSIPTDALGPFERIPWTAPPE